MLIVQRHYGTFHFDPRKNGWTKVLAGNKDDSLTPYGHDEHSIVYDDPVGGHGLLVRFQTNDVWAYEPEKNELDQVIAGRPIRAQGK